MCLPASVRVCVWVCLPLLLLSLVASLVVPLSLSLHGHALNFTSWRITSVSLCQQRSLSFVVVKVPLLLLGLCRCHCHCHCLCLGSASSYRWHLRARLLLRPLLPRPPQKLCAHLRMHVCVCLNNFCVILYYYGHTHTCTCLTECVFVLLLTRSSIYKAHTRSTHSHTHSQWAVVLFIIHSKVKK